MRVLVFVWALFAFLVRIDGFTIQSPLTPLIKVVDSVGTKNVLVGSFLTTTGDIISQNIEMRCSKGSVDEKKYSPTRSLQWAVFGLFVNGMFLNWWFKFLAQLVPLRKGNIVDVLKKVTVNQIFLAPGLNAIVFLYSILTAKDSLSLSEKLEKFFNKCRKDLPSTMRRSTMFWGSVQICNFSFCPLEHHALVTNIASIFWGTYVNLVSYRKIS